MVTAEKFQDTALAMPINSVLAIVTDIIDKLRFDTL